MKIKIVLEDDEAINMLKYYEMILKHPEIIKEEFGKDVFDVIKKDIKDIVERIKLLTSDEPYQMKYVIQQLEDEVSQLKRIIHA